MHHSIPVLSIYILTRFFQIYEFYRAAFLWIRKINTIALFLIFPRRVFGSDLCTFLALRLNFGGILQFDQRDFRSHICVWSLSKVQSILRNIVNLR